MSSSQNVQRSLSPFPMALPITLQTGAVAIATVVEYSPGVNSGGGQLPGFSVVVTLISNLVDPTWPLWVNVVESPPFETEIVGP
jgi:hypothetical protein